MMEIDFTFKIGDFVMLKSAVESAIVYNQSIVGQGGFSPRLPSWGTVIERHTVECPAGVQKFYKVQFENSRVELLEEILVPALEGHAAHLPDFLVACREHFQATIQQKEDQT